jgi:hypothetical protein
MCAGTKLIKLAGGFAVLLYTGISMASSLVLLSASQVAGQWALLKDGEPESCSLELRTVEYTEASGYELASAGECLSRWVSAEAVAWRPIPAGLALLDSTGSSLILFSLEGDEYRTLANASEPQQLLLRRVTP